MGRLLPRFLCVVVIVAVAAPGFAASTRRTVGCAGRLASGDDSYCATSFRLSHFNARDAIDYNTLVARVESPQAMSWRVTGALSDARGVTYFQWYCAARRSAVTMGNETYVEKSCEASRKTVRVRRNGRYRTEYYVADTSKPQKLHLWASVGACAPSCRFAGAATYVLNG